MKMNTACKMKFMSPWHFYEYSNVLTKEIKYVLFTDVIMTDTISRDWEFPKVLVSKLCVCTDSAPEPRPHVLMFSCPAAGIRREVHRVLLQGPEINGDFKL